MMTRQRQAQSLDNHTDPDPATSMSWVTAGAVLLSCRASLTRAGFGVTLQRAERWAPIVDRTRRRPRPSPAAVSEAVARVASFLPGRMRCLEQAVAVYFLLRRFGYRPALRIGVTPFGFRAHAWVEVDGHPLRENDDELRHLRTMPIPSHG
jgi:hypothetical protein